jgi:hypothetical protein
MKLKTTPRSLHRRDFLIRGAATMGAAASLAIVGRANSAPAEPLITQGVPIETKGDSGYRLTPHVQEYYTKARF